jgi:hypothetical protein
MGKLACDEDTYRILSTPGQAGLGVDDQALRVLERAGRWQRESGKNRERLCGQRLVIGGVGEVGVPASVVVGEGVVEDSGARGGKTVGGRSP